MRNFVKVFVITALFIGLSLNSAFAAIQRSIAIENHLDIDIVKVDIYEGSNYRGSLVDPISPGTKAYARFKVNKSYTYVNVRCYMRNGESHWFDDVVVRDGEVKVLKLVFS